MNKFEKVGQHFLSLTKHTTHCQLSAGLSGEHRFCLSRYRPPLAFPSAPFLCLIFVPFHYPMVRSKCSPSRSPPPSLLTIQPPPRPPIISSHLMLVISRVTWFVPRVTWSLISLSNRRCHHVTRCVYFP